MIYKQFKGSRGFVYFSKMIIFVKSIKEHHNITFETIQTQLLCYLSTKEAKMYP